MHTATSLNLLYDYDFKLDVTDQLSRIHAAGFDYIDINFWDWGYSPKSPLMQDNWQDWVKRIREFGEKNGVRYHQAHAMAYNPFKDGQDIPWLEEAARRSVIGAGMLGIDWIVFHCADRNTGWGVTDKNDPKFADEETQIRLNHEFLDPFVELADKSGTGIALENMNSGSNDLRYPNNADTLNRIVDTFDPRLVGVCWDIGHAHCSHLDQYAEITKLGKRLKVLHVQDNNGQQDQHMQPYFGTVDWKAVKRGLIDCGYEGEFTFEAHMSIRRCPDDATKDAAIRLLYLIGQHVVEMDV